MAEELDNIDFDELEADIEKSLKESKENDETKPKATLKDDPFPELNPITIQRDLAFNTSNMDKAFTSQAGLYFRYGELSARVTRSYEDMKLKIGILESKIYTELRASMENEKKKPTEALLEKNIKLDPRYQKAMVKLNNLRHLASIAKETLEAFKQKRDMLIQKGADIREEMKGNLHLNSSDKVEERKSAAISRMAREA